MKRTMILSTAAGLMLVFGVAVTASAQSTPITTPTAPTTCANGNWVDANGDGVCDTAPRDGSGQRFGQQGMSQPQGMGNGQGANFVDQNKDGTCDNFVDADGNGACDNCGGQRHGQRGDSGQAMGSRGGRGMQGMGHSMRGGMGRGAQN